MRITVVSHDTFWPLRGGGGIRVYWLVKKLLERDHEVTVIAPYTSTDGLEEEFPRLKALKNAG